MNNAGRGKTFDEIQVEADKVDTLLQTGLAEGDELVTLEAYQNALQWVLGAYSDTPTSRLD